MSAVVEKFISTDGTLRVSAVICTDVIQEAQKVHQSYPVATAALGRALIGAGLLASFMKERGKLALHFKGDGPLGQVFAEGSTDGNLRGFVARPQVQIPSKNGKLDVGSAMGKGQLTVAISQPNDRQPYTGTVELQSGEIGEDIAYYLFQSQQTPSVVALGVFVEADGSVGAAGGSLLEVMPGVSDKTLAVLEETVKGMSPVTELIRQGAKTEDLAFEVLENFSFRKLESKTTFQYKCDCSMVKVERSILLLGEGEIGAMLEENKPSEVTCDFCGRKYTVDVPTLEGLKRLAQRGK